MMSRENLVLCSYQIDDVKKDVKQKVHPITFIGIGFEWLNMAYEMGNSNVSGLEEEAVEASNSTSDTESELLGMSINDDRQETETKEEVNFSKNGSSKPAQEAGSPGTSSKTFEQVPRTQDKSMTATENKQNFETLSGNEDTMQAVNESKTNGVSSSQSELMMVGSDSGNGKENVENRELTEMTPISETVPTEFPTTECNNEEETEQTEEKIIEGTEEEKENFLAVGISTEAIEKPELDTGIFQGVGNEAVDIAVDERRKSLRFNSDLSMKAKSEESDQSPLLHHKKTRTRSLSMVFAEEKTIDIAVDELRIY
ncbi:hypothetical protein RHGRI_012237 [Rhododendron griersonianum]|uniref:Uncharacterized protein n=1 Tax=Rhododendron griersonianum TaxID=479676 RepID=A0AAV6KQA8_9ERIC|nr:hypothetical protein RHGRI_012237 [Rhododendron griersonianum]